MNLNSETATLPGVAASISERGRGPVFGAGNRSECIKGDGLARVEGAPSCCDPEWPLWHVETEALAPMMGVGPAFRWTLMSGHVEIDVCPDWHDGKIRRCEHVEDMERLAATRESLRRLGVPGVRS